METELALKISKLVHDTCGKDKDVPHDIGLQIVVLIEATEPEAVKSKSSDLLCGAIKTISDKCDRHVLLEFGNGVILRDGETGEIITTGFKRCAKEISKTT